MVQIGFNVIFDFIITIYDMLNITSMIIWDWFSSPIPSDIAEFLSIPIDTMNIELMLGSFVPVMLTLTLVGAVFKALFPN